MADEHEHLINKPEDSYQGQTELECVNKKMTQLDLSNVPELMVLNCFLNQLIELDLSNLPELRELICHQN